MTATEPFLKHESYSSNPGGFSLIVNGIHIHNRKVVIVSNNQDSFNFLFQGTWDRLRNIGEMLWDFEDFANLTNNGCDANKGSFDAMVLLTGRGRELLGGQGASGIAIMGHLCEM